MEKRNKFAFSLAEVLIVIAIVGVVSALLIPIISKDIKNKEYVAARAKMLQTFGEASRQIAVNGEIRDAEDAEDFVENYLSKKLKIIKTCKNTELRKCGIETKTNKIFNNNEYPMTMPTKTSELSVSANSGVIDSESYGFVIANGYSVNLFYNPSCLTAGVGGYNHAQRVCINAVYDMNGLAGPNQVGKDIGIVSIMYPDVTARAVALSVLNPRPSGEAQMKPPVGQTFEKQGEYCSKQGKSLNIEAMPPDRTEIASIGFNSKLFAIFAQGAWTSTAYDEDFGYWADLRGDGIGTSPKDIGRYVWCVSK